MTSIVLLSDDEMDAEVRELVATINDEYGFKPNILRALAHCPDLFKAFVPLWAVIYQSPYLTRRMRAVIALGTAYAQECEYCIRPMQQSAAHAGLSQTEIEQLRLDDSASLTNEEHLVFRYAKALTTGSKMDCEFESAFHNSFTDQQRVNIALAVGVYNMTGKFLKGLQIEPDLEVAIRDVDFASSAILSN